MCVCGVCVCVCVCVCVFVVVVCLFVCFFVLFLCCCFFFFNQTTEVITFRLRGWCRLGVFLLPAFTRLGHECQDLLSPREGMRASTE